MRMRRPIGLRPPRNLLHERLVDDRHRRRAVDEIGRGEQPAGDRARANRLEEAVADRVPGRGLRRHAPARRRSARRPSAAAADTAAAAAGRRRRRPRPAARAPRRPRVSRISGVGMRPSCAVSTWFFGSAGISSMNDVERARHRHRAVQQRHRQRDLDDQQHRADPAEAAEREAAAGVERVAQIVPRHAQRRQQSAHRADQQRQQDHERDDARIRIERDPERPALERALDVAERRVRAGQPDDRGDRSEHQRLEEQLTDDARARGAERGSDRELRRARPRAREHQRRDVARHHQQHHDQHERPAPTSRDRPRPTPR